MKIFLAATSLDASYGGPAYSVSRLASALVASGVEVGLWSSDGSTPWGEAARDQRGVRFLRGSSREALEDFGRPDIIHDNGLWMPHNHRLARLATRRAIARVVSTRGMLEKWALDHKRVKKRMAWSIYQRNDLEMASGHHVTSTTELETLSQLDLGVPLRLIPNGVDLPPIPPRSESDEDRDGVRTALFVGRLYPVKGLPMLVEAWGRLRPEGWRLRIVGPDERGHRRVIESAIAERGLETAITLSGPLTGDSKGAAFLGASLFVLPTHSESFGMAIAEALAHGLPVLTTTAAPWPELREFQCGWRVDVTVDGITEGLRAAVALDSAALSRMGSAGRDLVASRYRWDEVANRFVAFYSDVATTVR